MCLVSALSSVTTNLTFTTGVYVAPVRDLITVAKSVGTAAVLSHDRVRLGVGVGWCEEEYIQTGQDFHTRGKRLDDMIPALRALWQGGWVEYHGPYYDVPICQMNPSPSRPVPIIGGGDSPAALRRASTLCDGWVNTGAVAPDEALVQVERIKGALHRAGRGEEPFALYVAVRAFPDLDLYRRLEDAGVTDLLCAPWMSVRAGEGDTPESVHRARLAASEGFAEQFIAKLA
jgi:alkanesulfonate monooxygenase SsuD/methylene tetrahydromethanopterin reductase-like flavin-dependent oxidoreductase (luciferase family)